MKVVATRSVQHLANALSMPIFSYTIKQFSDGELYVKLNASVQDEAVWVIAGTQAPAENMLELFFLLNALTNAGTQTINVFFVYFAYARQVQADNNEACSAQVICDTLKQFAINRSYILHAHAADDLHTLLNFTNVIDFDFFSVAAQEVDIIVAPDKDAVECAQKIGLKYTKEVIALEKKRPGHEMVVIKSIDSRVAGKKILVVDDIISTGRTLLHAAQVLKEAGATQISAAVTHSLCNAQTYLALNTIFEKISVTNSITQKNISKTRVWDIADFISRIIIAGAL